ncbi:hypothetical protein COSO111634_30420 [Corallococcus soli]
MMALSAPRLACERIATFFKERAKRLTGRMVTGTTTKTKRKSFASMRKHVASSATICSPSLTYDDSAWVTENSTSGTSEVKRATSSPE